MPHFLLNKLSRPGQILLSVGLVSLISGICFAFSSFIDYKIVAFILLLCVSFLAVVFDIIPVLIASTLSALIWNFFFIEPRFTFMIHTTEDTVLLSMYFLVAIINGVLTYRMRKIEKMALEKEEKAKTIKLYNTLFNTLSHELKTPIATIIAATDNLKENTKNLTKENKEELVSEISVAS